MWLILVDRAASMGQPFRPSTSDPDALDGMSKFDVLRRELPRRLGQLRPATDVAVLMFGPADETWASTRSTSDDSQLGRIFDAGPTQGETDLAPALWWAEQTIADGDRAEEIRLVVISDLRTTQFRGAIEASAGRLREHCAIDVLLMGPSGDALFVADRIATGQVIPVTGAAETAHGLARLFVTHDEATGAIVPDAAPSQIAGAAPPPNLAQAPRPNLAQAPRPFPAQAPPYGLPHGVPPPRSAGGFGVVGGVIGGVVGAASAVGGAIGSLFHRTKSGPDPHERLAFTAAYPPEVVTGRSFTLLFVLYRSGLSKKADKIVRALAHEIGSEPATSSIAAPSPVARGTILTLVPAIPGVACDPARVDVAWQGTVQNTTFHLRAESGAGGARVGSIEVYVGPLLLALVPVALRVLTADTSTVARQRSTVSHAESIDRVFASYSRRDASIVEACTAAYLALGVEVLIDRRNLRSGEEWRSSLHSLIAQSDLFQLYWSEASASSAEVESEWRYAHGLTEKGARFIRPMFWETPMPDPPVELSHLHFSRIELDQIAGLPRKT